MIKPALRNREPATPGKSPGSTLLRAIKPQTLQHLIFSPRNVMEGAYSGKHASNMHGASPEFIEHRAYVPGDPLSIIDWRAYARSDRFYVRLTEHETDATCHIVIDSSASMNFKGCHTGYSPGLASSSKLEVATVLAASLMYLLVHQGDRAGCTVFSDKIEWSHPAVGTRSKLHAIFARLESQKAKGKTDLAVVLQDLSALLSRRGVVIIISDFYTEPALLFRGLGPFIHRRDDIILFHLLHPHELTLPDIGAARLQDMETNERINCSPRELQTRHTAIMKEHIDAIRTGAFARGIDYNLIRSDQTVHDVLQHHLVRRGGYRH